MSDSGRRRCIGSANTNTTNYITKKVKYIYTGHILMLLTTTYSGRLDVFR